MQLNCVLVIFMSHIFVGTVITVGNQKNDMFLKKNVVIGFFGSDGDKLRSPLTSIANKNKNFYKITGNNKFYVRISQPFSNRNIYRTSMPTILAYSDKMIVHPILKDVPFVRKLVNGFNYPIMDTNSPLEMYGRNILNNFQLIRHIVPCKQELFKFKKIYNLVPLHYNSRVVSENSRVLFEAYKDFSKIDKTETRQGILQSNLYFLNGIHKGSLGHELFTQKSSVSRREEIITDHPVLNDKNIQNNSFEHLPENINNTGFKDTNLSKKESTISVLPIVQQGQVKSVTVSSTTDIYGDTAANELKTNSFFSYTPQKTETALEHLNDKYQNVDYNKLNKSMEIENKDIFVSGILKINETLPKLSLFNNKVNITLGVLNGNDSVPESNIPNTYWENRFTTEQMHEKEVIEDSTKIINYDEISADNAYYDELRPVLSDIPIFSSDNSISIVSDKTIYNNHDNSLSFESKLPIKSSTERLRVPSRHRLISQFHVGWTIHEGDCSVWTQKNYLILQNGLHGLWNLEQPR